MLSEHASKVVILCRSSIMILTIVPFRIVWRIRIISVVPHRVVLMWMNIMMASKLVQHWVMRFMHWSHLWMVRVIFMLRIEMRLKFEWWYLLKILISFPTEMRMCLRSWFWEAINIRWCSC